MADTRILWRGPLRFDLGQQLLRNFLFDSVRVQVFIVVFLFGQSCYPCSFGVGLFLGDRFVNGIEGALDQGFKVGFSLCFVQDSWLAFSSFSVELVLLDCPPLVDKFSSEDVSKAFSQGL